MSFVIIVFRAISCFTALCAFNIARSEFLDPLSVVVSLFNSYYLEGLTF